MRVHRLAAALLAPPTIVQPSALTRSAHPQRERRTGWWAASIAAAVLVPCSATAQETPLPEAQVAPMGQAVRTTMDGMYEEYRLARFRLNLDAGQPYAFCMQPGVRARLVLMAPNPGGEGWFKALGRDVSPFVFNGKANEPNCYSAEAKNGISSAVIIASSKGGAPAPLNFMVSPHRSEWGTPNNLSREKRLATFAAAMQASAADTTGTAGSVVPQRTPAAPAESTGTLTVAAAALPQPSGAEPVRAPLDQVVSARMDGAHRDRRMAQFGFEVGAGQAYLFCVRTEVASWLVLQAPNPDGGGWFGTLGKTVDSYYNAEPNQPACFPAVAHDGLSHAVVIARAKGGVPTPVSFMAAPYRPEWGAWQPGREAKGEPLAAFVQAMHVPTASSTNQVAATAAPGAAASAAGPSSAMVSGPGAAPAGPSAFAAAAKPGDGPTSESDAILATIRSVPGDVGPLSVPNGVDAKLWGPLATLGGTAWMDPKGRICRFEWKMVGEELARQCERIGDSASYLFRANASRDGLGVWENGRRMAVTVLQPDMFAARSEDRRSVFRVSEEAITLTVQVLKDGVWFDEASVEQHRLSPGQARAGLDAIASARIRSEEQRRMAETAAARAAAAKRDALRADWGVVPEALGVWRGADGSVAHVFETKSGGFAMDTYEAAGGSHGQVSFIREDGALMVQHIYKGRILEDGTIVWKNPWTWAVQLKDGQLKMLRGALKDGVFTPGERQFAYRKLDAGTGRQVLERLARAEAAEKAERSANRSKLLGTLAGVAGAVGAASAYGGNAQQIVGAAVYGAGLANQDSESGRQMTAQGAAMVQSGGQQAIPAASASASSSSASTGAALVAADEEDEAERMAKQAMAQARQTMAQYGASDGAGLSPELMDGFLGGEAGRAMRAEADAEAQTQAEPAAAEPGVQWVVGPQRATQTAAPDAGRRLQQDSKNGFEQAMRKPGEKSAYTQQTGATEGEAERNYFDHLAAAYPNRHSEMHTCANLMGRWVCKGTIQLRPDDPSDVKAAPEGPARASSQ